MVTLGVFGKTGNIYEMYTICNKLNINVINSIDKILSYFIKKTECNQLKTKINRSYFNEDVYFKNDFILDSKTEPNCYYLINNKKENINNHNTQNPLKIYDSGDSVLIYSNK